MRHDGKRMLQLYVSPDTLSLIRGEAKARKMTMSAYVTESVEQKCRRDQAPTLCNHCLGSYFVAGDSNGIRCGDCGKRPWTKATAAERVAMKSS